MATSKEMLRSNIAYLKDQLAVQEGNLLTLASEEQGFDWEPLSDRFGILHDPQQRNGWSQVGYLGFATKREAQKCLRALKRQASANPPELRKARRLTTCKWEIKAVGIDSEVLHDLLPNGSQVA